MSELSYVDFKYKARFYSSRPISDKTKYVCLAFHGYGQLAKYFVNHFEGLGEEHVAIVPEGLHRFYKEGMSGRVVASWMTKEDRLTDIENQGNYINSIFDLVMKEVKGKNIKFWILGFSQGVATLIRWMVNNDIALEKAVFWAGSIPEDLPKEEVARVFHNVKSYSVIGNKDPFFQETSIKKQEEIQHAYSLNPERITFDGEHKINSEVLKAIVKEKIEFNS